MIFGEKRKIKNKEVTLWKPNLKEFFKALSEKNLPPEHRLTEDEVKALAEWFEKEVDVRLFGEFSHKISFPATISLETKWEANVFDAIASALKASIVIKESLEKSGLSLEGLYKKFGELKLPSGRPFKEIIDAAKPMFVLQKQHSQTYEKLKHLIIPEMLEVLFRYAALSADLMRAYFSQILGK